MIEKRISTERLNILWILSYLVAIVFALKLVNLQVLKYPHYRAVAEKNRTQIIPKSAPRGRIFTVDGVTVATSKPSFSLIYFPGQIKNVQQIDKIAANLSKVLKVSLEEIKNNLQKAVKNGTTTRLVENLSARSIFGVSEMKTVYPGIEIIMEAQRFYPLENFLSHLIGFIGKIDAKEWAQLSKTRKYNMDARIGKSGMEKIYEKQLRGKDGGIYLEVDSKGRLVRILESKKWEPGLDVYLTIDSVVQKAAEEGLRKSISGRGAVVAIDPRNGAVRAIASLPDYDPNIFISYKDEDLKPDYKSVRELNTAISGTYAPGSVFKIVVAAAAFELGKVSPEETFFCPGYFDAGDRVFKCWEKKGHNRMNFWDGMARSCGVYFFNIGLKTGQLNIEKFAKKFGFGMPTQFVLPDEKPGNIFGPTKRGLKRSYWFIGDTLNLSIGQGETLVTPIQMAQLASAVANRGTLYKPYCVEKIVNDAGKVIFKSEVEVLSKIELKERTWNLLHESLQKVVTEGTGRSAQIKGISVFGKTGTVQNPHGENHAWFVAFATTATVSAEKGLSPNRDCPSIAVAVLVEHGKQGATAAVPIAREVIKAYLRDYLGDRVIR